MYQVQTIFGNMKIRLASNTYSDSGAGANSVISGGIRTYTKPGTSDTVKVYIRTRKKGETTERGELSKTYYDNQ